MIDKSENRVVYNNSFFSADMFPNQEELNSYYKNKYYQESLSLNYQQSYDQSELNNFNLKIKIRLIILEKFLANLHGKKLIDVGCGEGFFMKEAMSKGLSVQGIDFSSQGVLKNNPDLIGKVTQGDIFSIMDKLHRENNLFDVVILNNILEHVIDPLDLLKKSHNLMNKNGVILITVPNDFSDFQVKLLQDKKIDHEYWVKLPDHLHYFNYKNLIEVLRKSDFETIEMISDFPIEWFLANDESNYVIGRDKGKNAHLSRNYIETFINEFQDWEKVIKFWASLAELGLGRNISIFARKQKN
jgi:2-polyprenyl-3-methyl-5-hydroxy-6-metoxy-1,4-benzoquinol methylase